MVELNKIQFDFMPGKGTMDALFIMKKLKEYLQMIESCTIVL